MPNAHMTYALIAISAGIAVPILAAINSSYGQTIGNVNIASLTLVCGASLTVLAVVLFTGTPLPDPASFRKAAWWHFTAGCFIAYYVLSITYVAPRFGVGNAIVFVVVAQIFTAVTIDHFGLFGAAIQALDWRRALGILFLIAGVALAKSSPAATAASGG